MVFFKLDEWLQFVCLITVVNHCCVNQMGSFGVYMSWGFLQNASIIKSVGWNSKQDIKSVCLVLAVKKSNESTSSVLRERVTSRLRDPTAHIANRHTPARAIAGAVTSQPALLHARQWPDAADRHGDLWEESLEVGSCVYLCSFCGRAFNRVCSERLR